MTNQCFGSPDWVAQLVGAPSHPVAGLIPDQSISGLYIQSISRLLVRSPVRSHMGSNQSVFLFHTNVCLSVSQINKHILGEDIKKNDALADFTIIGNLLVGPQVGFSSYG